MSRFHDDDGQALVLAMGFLAFFGIVIGALVGFTRSSVVTTESLSTQRSTSYVADAALEVAIRAGRVDPAIGAFGTSGATCMHSAGAGFTTTATTTDATTATVTCTPKQAPLADRDVVFTATVGGVAVAVAEVRYLDDPLVPASASTPSQAQVLKWTYCGHDNACS
jgi:hypothetical protein